MAKREKPWASKAPMKKPAKPSRMKPDRPAAAPKAPKIPDTREDLLAQIGVVFDKIDARMAEKRQHQVHFLAWSPTLKEAEPLPGLVKRLQQVLEKTEPVEDAQSVIEAAYGATPGTVPAWARPGTFLLWINYIPCRCDWGGAAFPSATIYAVDPSLPWIVPSGAIGISAAVPSDCPSVEDVFRAKLTALTAERKVKHSNSYREGKDLGPKFELLPLDPETGRAATEKYLAMPECAWLVEALARGEVNPIPLPPHLRAIQLAWFG